MKTRIVLAAATLSLAAAGTAFAGEAPQAAWPELNAPISTAPIATNVGPVLNYGDNQVTWDALEMTPKAATRAARADSTIKATAPSISTDGQFPWPELERGLSRG